MSYLVIEEIYIFRSWRKNKINVKGNVPNVDPLNKSCIKEIILYLIAFEMKLYFEIMNSCQFRENILLFSANK